MNTEKLEKLLVTNETLLRVISSLVKTSHSNPKFINEQLSKFENKHKSILLEIERITEFQSDNTLTNAPLAGFRDYTNVMSQSSNNWELLAFGKEEKLELHPFEVVFNELEKDGPLRERIGIEVSVVDLLERKEQKQIIDLLSKVFEKADQTKDNG